MCQGGLKGSGSCHKQGMGKMLLLCPPVCLFPPVFWLTRAAVSAGTSMGCGGFGSTGASPPCCRELHHLPYHAELPL